MLRPSIKYYLLLVIPVILTSCEQLLSDVDAPKIDPKIVVTSFISPEQELIQVNVSKTRAIYEQTNGSAPEDLTIKNARVVLYQGNDSVPLQYNTQSFNYQIDQSLFPITPGLTYNLKVTAPGNFLAEATCTVPAEAAPVLEITSIDSNEYNEKTINFRFKDLTGEGNYYRVNMAMQYSWYQDELYPGGFQFGESLVTDKNKDGLYFNYSTYPFYSSTQESITHYFAISHCDTHYYEYHKTVDQDEGDNPFAEPSPIYSNITGGLGVFAAYREFKFSITF